MGVPADTLHLKSSTRGYRLTLGSNMYRRSIVGLLLREIKGIFGRIQTVKETQIYRRGVQIDPGHLTAISPVERERIADACSLDKDNLSKERPHLSLLDYEIYVLGWTQGHEWSVRNYCK